MMKSSSLIGVGQVLGMAEQGSRITRHKFAVRVIISTSLSTVMKNEPGHSSLSLALSLSRVPYAPANSLSLSFRLLLSLSLCVFSIVLYLVY